MTALPTQLDVSVNSRGTWSHNKVAGHNAQLTNNVGDTVTEEYVVPGVIEQDAVAYRAGVSAVDVLAAMGTITCTKQAGGSATAGVYNTKVCAVNKFGRTIGAAGNATVTTETSNLTIRVAFAAVAGAVSYDIFCSTDVDPKWVGRVTEAQRAAGKLMATVNTPTAGGTAGAIDVQTPGTGDVAPAVNTAYVIPASPVSAVNQLNIGLDIAAVRDPSAAITLTIVPFYLDGTEGDAFQGTPITVTFGSLRQRLVVPVRGNRAVSFVVTAMTGISSLSMWTAAS